MKFVNKEDLKFDGGYVMDLSGEIIGLPEKVWSDLRDLEMLIQKNQYVAKVSKIAAKPEIPEFKFKSAFEADAKMPLPETPITDARVAESLAFADEVDKTTDVLAYNNWIERHPELAEFVASDRFIPSAASACRLDAVNVGNPLELTKEKLFDLIRLAMED